MIDIVIATDRPYVPWAATAILSVLDRHAPNDVCFHVLHDGGLASDDVRALEGLALNAGNELRTAVVRDDRVAALRPMPSGSRVTWYSMLVPELVSAERALLIDADTFVADSLASLWATDLGDAPIAAVANVVEPGRHRHVRSLGIDDPRSYFNAGVLLMDLERMRREDASSTLVRFAQENAERDLWWDQDVLNVVFAGRWHALHPRWNTMNSLWTWRQWATDVFGPAAVSEAVSSPAILHFEGPSLSKPWHYVSTHPWRDAYRSTLERTPWASTPLVDRTPLTRLLRLLPPRWRVDAYVKLRRERAFR